MAMYTSALVPPFKRRERGDETKENWRQGMVIKIHYKFLDARQIELHLRAWIAHARLVPEWILLRRCHRRFLPVSRSFLK